MPPDAAPDAADHAVNAQADRFAAVLGPHIAPGEPFALLDFPDHGNVGDSAIYAGELAFLDRAAGRPPSYVGSARTYRGDVAAFCPEGPILLHGGGNFGDLWPRHHALRLDVLTRYRDRKVVQLPQSIHFGDPATIAATARAIGAHPDFTLLVRDEPSRDLALKHFDCPVRLCPDAAYNLRRLPAATQGQVPVLSLLRTDHEAAGAADLADALARLGPVVDWPAPSRWRPPILPRTFDRLLASRLPASGALMRQRERTFRRQALALVRRGARLLETGRIVVSDRLHAHILCSLLRRPHVVLDNAYGKIGRYIAAWGDDALAVPAADRAELAARIEALGGAAWPPAAPLTTASQGT